MDGPASSCRDLLITQNGGHVFTPEIICTGHLKAPKKGHTEEPEV